MSASKRKDSNPSKNNSPTVIQSQAAATAAGAAAGSLTAAAAAAAAAAAEQNKPKKRQPKVPQSQLVSSGHMLCLCDVELYSVGFRPVGELCVVLCPNNGVPERESFSKLGVSSNRK